CPVRDLQASVIGNSGIRNQKYETELKDKRQHNHWSPAGKPTLMMARWNQRTLSSSSMLGATARKNPIFASPVLKPCSLRPLRQKKSYPVCALRGTSMQSRCLLACICTKTYAHAIGDRLSRTPQYWCEVVGPRRANSKPTSAQYPFLPPLRE